MLKHFVTCNLVAGLILATSASAQTVSFDDVHGLCKDTFIAFAHKDYTYLNKKMEGLSVDSKQKLTLACGMYISGVVDTIEVFKKIEEEKAKIHAV